MAAMMIELPDSVAQEINERHIPPQQLRAFVVEAIEAWLRMQAENQVVANAPSASRFAESAQPFIEKLVRENRALFEQLAAL